MHKMGGKERKGRKVEEKKENTVPAFILNLYT